MWETTRNSKAFTKQILFSHYRIFIFYDKFIETPVLIANNRILQTVFLYNLMFESLKNSN